MEKENKNEYKKVQFILLTILFANLLVAILKIILGYSISSSSILADGVHSLTDGASNIVGLVGIYFAKKPADCGHPYGHEKIEMLSSLLIGISIAFLGIKIFLRSISLFKNPVIPKVSVEALFLILFTLVVNLVVTIWENKKGKELKSNILISDAKHTKSDICVSIGVLISLIGLKLGLPYYVDALVSCVLAFFIFYSALEILRDNVGILLDGKILDKEEIEKIVLEFPEVKGVHKIRTRGSLAHVYTDFHILVVQDMTVNDSHELFHRIEEKLIKKFKIKIDVHIHVEPYSPKEKIIDF